MGFEIDYLGSEDRLFGLSKHDLKNFPLFEIIDFHSSCHHVIWVFLYCLVKTLNKIYVFKYIIFILE